ncbi:hypothetical protein Tco_0195449 [Tanacetum coccineum]
MTSFNYHLSPIYVIKECSSCGSFYTSNCGCSKGSLEDKILVPIPDSPQQPIIIEKICFDCGDLVRGLYCRECALIRKTFEEVFQDFQDTSESTDDNTNAVNAPREPFVVKHDPGENSSPSLPQIDHCCHECGDSLDGIFCRRCTEIGSGTVPNPHSELSLPDYKAFYIDNDHFKEKSCSANVPLLWLLSDSGDLTSIDPGIDFPDCEDSRARSFTLHPQEFHILSFILGIQYPNLID